MRRVVFALIPVLIRVTGLVAAAAVVDFDDLVPGTRYYTGDTFESSGVPITVQSFQWSNGTWFSGGSATVQQGSFGFGSSNTMFMGNVNLSFGFGSVPGLSLAYGEYGGNLNVSVNGDFRNFENFRDINGSRIGGALVSVTTAPVHGGYSGILVFDGTITSFSVGGQEFRIDDVTPVPEPGGLAALCSGLIGLAVFACRKAP